MAARPIPYPPSPAWIPADLTEPDAETERASTRIMIGLILFVAAYGGLLLVCLAAVITAVVLVVRSRGYVCVVLPVALIFACFAFLLIRALFTGRSADREIRVEITEDDHPTFFKFLRLLTNEVGASMPHRVFAEPDVTAAMSPEVSLINLVVPPRKNLIVGLGLVNSLNLSEFKAVMGHEFGHFCQKSNRLQVHVHIAVNVMASLHGRGEDWVSQMGKEAARSARRGDEAALIMAVVYMAIGGPVWLVTKVIAELFSLIMSSSLSLSRANEFHADRVAVSVSGSNAIVHSLARLGFAGESLGEAVRVLEIASQHKLYSRDLYLHQTTSADRLRKDRKKPWLGMSPSLKSPEEGRDVQVFDEDDDEDCKIPEMWRTHPKNFDREENAKKVFVPSENNDRSPWILFDDAEELRERMTYKVYRAVLRAKKSVALSPAAKVQKFIDQELSEVTFDAKYRGAYDERNIDPGNIRELNEQIDAEPWEAGRIDRSHGRLFLEIGPRAKDLKTVRERIRKIYRKAYGRPHALAERKLRDAEDDLNDLVEWFGAFDRRVYLIHGQMATKLDDDRRAELTRRYEFHLEVQILHRNLAMAMDRVDDVMEGLKEHEPDNLPTDFFQYVMETFRAARRTMKNCLERAREMRTPEMAHVKEGSRFDWLIFDQEVLRELPLSFAPGPWQSKLIRQLNRMRLRLNRMDFKSLGAILLMQDQLAADWRIQTGLLETVVGNEVLPEAILLETPVNEKPVTEE